MRPCDGDPSHFMLGFVAKRLFLTLWSREEKSSITERVEQTLQRSSTWMKLSRTLIIGPLIPDRVNSFWRRPQPEQATLLSQFSRTSDAPDPSSEDVLDVVGQQDELLRDRVMHMVERLEEIRSLRDEFALLVEPLLALAREHPQFHSRLVEAETSLRRERAVIEKLSKQIDDLTHQKMSLADELALESAHVRKQAQTIQEQAAAIEDLRRARQDAETLAVNLQNELAAEAERAQAASTASERLRVAAADADQTIAQSDRDLTEAREKIELLEHDNQSLRRATEDQAERIGELTSRTGELDRQLAEAQRQTAEFRAKLAAEQTERQKAEAQREAEWAAAQTKAASLEVRIDGLNARIAATDKILSQTRDQLRDKNQALLALERSQKEAAIDRQRLERRVDALQQDLDRRVREVEELAKARAELAERSEALLRSVAAKEAVIEAAEAKAAKSAGRIDEINARFQQERSELQAANRALMEELQGERSERALAQGALEISRANRAKIQKQLSALRRKSRSGRGGEPPRIDYAAEDIESEAAGPKP